MRDRFVGHMVETVESWPERHKIRARARFLDGHRLALEDGSKPIGLVRAGRIVIATGARPRVPAMFAPLGDRAITSDDLFELDDLPRSMAVFGGGVIGLELGQALHRLGVRVVLFGKGGRVAQLTDAEVTAHAAHLLVERFPFHPDADTRRVARTEDGIEVEHVVDGRSTVERFDLALVAAGRTPDLSGLDLEKAGLELDENGVPKCDGATRRCGESGIFIAGDADADPPLLHVAADTGKSAGAHAAGAERPQRSPLPAFLSITFCDPQIATVGETRRALEGRGADFAIGRLDWEDQGRARVMDVNAGLLHLYGERPTGRFLGAEMIGPQAEHLAHLLAWAKACDLTVEEMLERPFYHPCLEEGLRTALRRLRKDIERSPREPIPRCLDCGPGG